MRRDEKKDQIGLDWKAYNRYSGKESKGILKMERKINNEDMQMCDVRQIYGFVICAIVVIKFEK